MFRNRWPFLSVGVLVASGFVGCGDDAGPAAPGSQTITGETLAMGNGTVHSWGIVDDGRPKSVGVTFSATALNGLPVLETEFTLSLPWQAAAAFDHVGLNWNPHGHPPPGVYDPPHFDVHFYRITEQERLSITVAGDDTLKVMNIPGVAFRPLDYAPDTQGVPTMGLHWVDPNSPEFQGQPFTRTFIYGSYDGQFIFWEPMLTIAYLRTNPNENLAIKQPAQYPQANRFYPLRYSVRYNAATQEYTVAMEDLTLRN